MERFLENLESHLTVLEASEQKKIIKRFQKELEEKIKEGMSEEEAIKSLGSLDSIVSSIYEEYHLNKKNISEKSSVGGTFNSGMRKCANFLSDTCIEIAYYITHISNNALETFFEILLKILVLVIVILFLKLPFLLIENILQFGLTFLFYPFDMILTRILDFVLAVVYLMICISLSLMMFKGYVKSKDTLEEKEKKEIDKKDKMQSSETSRNYAYIILKVCLYIIFIIPMIFITLILLLLTGLALFFVYKGVSIIGLVVLLVGLLFLSIVVTTYITDALDDRNRSHTLALIVTVISLISGGILLVDNLMNFNYPKELDNSAFIALKETTTLDIKDEKMIANLSGKVEFVVDNSIQDNQILIELAYFDELYDVLIKEDETSIFFQTTRDDFEVGDVRYLYKNIFTDLANNTIYEYGKLSNVDIVIYGNEKAKELLKIIE